jgi:hypothetical protein
VNGEQQLTEALAHRVLGWKTAPNRYLISNRRWLPRWRFQPTEKIADAFQLLEADEVADYVLHVDCHDVCWVKVRTNVASAEASGSSLPLTICIAVARAYDIEMEAG